MRIHRTEQAKRKTFFLKQILELIYRLGEGFDGERVGDAAMAVSIEKGPKGRWKEASGGSSLSLRQKASPVGRVRWLEVTGEGSLGIGVDGFDFLSGRSVESGGGAWGVGSSYGLEQCRGE